MFWKDRQHRALVLLALHAAASAIASSMSGCAPESPKVADSATLPLAHRFDKLLDDPTVLRRPGVDRPAIGQADGGSTEPAAVMAGLAAVPTAVADPGVVSAATPQPAAAAAVAPPLPPVVVAAAVVPEPANADDGAKVGLTAGEKPPHKVDRVENDDRAAAQRADRTKAREDKVETEQKKADAEARRAEAEPKKAPALEQVQIPEGADATELYYSGKRKLEAGNLSAAILDLRAAQQLRPSARTLTLLGKAYFDAGDLSQAAKVLQGAGSHEDAQLLLGTLYQHQGKTAQARKVYEAFLKAHPDHGKAGWVGNLLKTL